MTYCLGILLPEGLVLASDSRTNAGVDQIALVRKLATFKMPGERMIALLSAGNLATTQAVVTLLRQAAGHGGERDLMAVESLFDAAVVVGDTYRAVLNQDQEAVRPYGDATGSFLIAGQIRGDRPRLFQMYPAGNFIEATPRTQFLQIGETKYGKPILDRALHFDSSIAHSAKLALLSFDATIRSNLSVGPPIDLLCYKKDSFSTDGLRKYSGNDEAWESIREAYSTGLMNVLENIPNPVTGVD
ncbi:peptidase [Hwanghaeella sp.]|uniref:peptidase n=1 Tax=Hwanghaeella sp. TaxID=2605943 RepID=UPI003CCB83D7